MMSLACKEQPQETTFERDRITGVWHYLGSSEWKAIFFNFRVKESRISRKSILGKYKIWHPTELPI